MMCSMLLLHGVRHYRSIRKIATSLTCTAYAAVALLLEQLAEPLAAFVRVAHTRHAPCAVTVAPRATSCVAVLHHVLALDVEATHGSDDLVQAPPWRAKPLRGQEAPRLHLLERDLPERP